MSTRNTLIEDNVRLLEQGVALLSELPGDLYPKPEPSVASSGIGSHVRHVIDYYRRMLAGVESGRLDYDQREREERIERELEYGCDRLRETIRALDGLRREVPAVEVPRLPAAEVPRLMVKMDAIDTTGRPAPWSTSSIERELQFVMSHTVHHFALIAVILRLNGREPAEGFGVAPSTLRYWEENPTCAR